MFAVIYDNHEDGGIDRAVRAPVYKHSCASRPVVALKSDVEIQKQSDGTFRIKTKVAETGDKVTALTLSTDDYGAYVSNYASNNSEAQQSVGWRIFHSDGENIYLIADDYVETQYIPAGKGGTEITTDTQDENAQGFSLTPLSDYAGWSDLQGSSIAKKWLKQYVSSRYTSTNYNMKATAYLLDKNVWNPVFANKNYAEYAIGGPTLELFAASYNATHTDKTIDTQVSSKVGYKVKWSTDTSYGNWIMGLNKSEDLYVISDNTNGIWIASPSAIGADNVTIVYFNGISRQRILP